MIAPMATTAAGLSHAFPLGSAVNQRGHLEIGGCDVMELVAEFGSPAYLVAEDDLRARARAYMSAVQSRHPDFAVLFGSKAFPCTAVYRVFAEEGLACDVASGGELHLALRGGFEPERIYVHGNAKSEVELRLALLAGVGGVVLDSFDDISRAERVAAELDRHQPVLVRVTPDIVGDTHRAISTGQADSKFGFGLAQAPEAIQRTQSSPHLELVGLHCHIGSQLLELGPFRSAVRALSKLGDFPTYNLGGGLGVAYTNAQHPPAVEEYVEAVVSAAHQWLGADKRLLFEPGRSLVANSTVTAYTVETVKRNVSTWVGVDGGMSDNLRPMLYGAVYEAVMADRPLATATEHCNLAGKHCESGDVIIHNVALPSPAVGDVVVTPATGAYGYSLANNYNSIPRPPVIFCRNGTPRVVVRRETYEDLTARDVD